MEKPVISTIGHSNRPIEEFVDLLWSNGVAHVLDVRTMPRSRHNPQFNLDILPVTLAQVGIDYTHRPELGGLRRTRADSPNGAWRNVSFRGYADYMLTPEFNEGVDWVAQQARVEHCVLMCAEAVPWRCHRSLIGDALLLRGFDVDDIIGAAAPRPHKLTAFARVDGTHIVYPPEKDATTIM